MRIRSTTAFGYAGHELGETRTILHGETADVREHYPSWRLSVNAREEAQVAFEADRRASMEAMTQQCQRQEERAKSIL